MIGHWQARLLMQVQAALRAIEMGGQSAEYLH
jgi:hypothetical protein